MIGRYLRAGVMVDGVMQPAPRGTPQGGPVSPLLSNLFLHEVLDRWFEEQIKPRLQGAAFLVRYADDAVMGFTHRRGAEGVLEVLPKRFGRYGLTLHPEKTRLVNFHRPPRTRQRDALVGQERPDSFAFLGFCHYWARSRRNTWVVRRTTAPDRLSRTLRSIAQWCRQHRHEPVAEQWRLLSQKVRGHYGYYGLIGNARSLAAFYFWVQRCWCKRLARRGGKRRRTGWEHFGRLLRRHPLPVPAVRPSSRAAAANL